jgi:hypothetical protein
LGIAHVISIFWPHHPDIHWYGFQNYDSNADGYGDGLGFGYIDGGGQGNGLSYGYFVREDMTHYCWSYK